MRRNECRRYLVQIVNPKIYYWADSVRRLFEQIRTGCIENKFVWKICRLVDIIVGMRMEGDRNFNEVFQLTFSGANAAFNLTISVTISASITYK